MAKCVHNKGVLKECGLPKMCINMTVTRETSHNTIVTRECAKPKISVKLPSTKNSKCEKTVKNDHHGRKLTEISCFCKTDGCN